MNSDFSIISNKNDAEKFRLEQAIALIDDFSVYDNHKKREAKLRRIARRQGFLLKKSRRRNPEAIDFAGYMLVNDRNCCVLGGSPYGFCSSLDDVEYYLSDTD